MVLISVFKNIEVHNLTYRELLRFILVMEEGDQLSNVEFDNVRAFPPQENLFSLSVVPYSLLCLVSNLYAKIADSYLKCLKCYQACSVVTVC